MSAAFDVTAQSEGEHAGRVEGDDLLRLAKFLRSSHGVPQFDVECEGVLFSNCRLTGTTSNDAILFSCDSISAIEAVKSDPNASYT